MTVRDCTCSQSPAFHLDMELGNVFLREFVGIGLCAAGQELFQSAFINLRRDRAPVAVALPSTRVHFVFEPSNDRNS